MLKKLNLTDEQIKRYYEVGYTASRIARFCGCSASTIIDRLERQDVPIRRQTSGIAFVIYQHHKDFKDDPEGFTDEFMMKMSQPVTRAKQLGV